MRREFRDQRAMPPRRQIGDDQIGLAGGDMGEDAGAGRPGEIGVADARQAQPRPARPEPAPQGMDRGAVAPEQEDGLARLLAAAQRLLQPGVALHEIGPQDALNLVLDRIRHRAVPSFETGPVRGDLASPPPEAASRDRKRRLS